MLAFNEANIHRIALGVKIHSNCYRENGIFIVPFKTSLSRLGKQSTSWVSFPCFPSSMGETDTPGLIL